MKNSMEKRINIGYTAGSSFLYLVKDFCVYIDNDRLNEIKFDDGECTIFYYAENETSKMDEFFLKYKQLVDETGYCIGINNPLYDVSCNLQIHAIPIDYKDFDDYLSYFKNEEHLRAV